MRTQSVAYDIRPYEDRDEDAVLSLLGASLDRGPAGARTERFFRWKHIDNPFGRSLMLLADAGGQIVGFRAFMRWRFAVDGEQIRAVRAVDTATHPAFQGMGIFSTLTTAAVEILHTEADLIFNTPNEKSLPGYLKMGWNRVAAVPIHVRPRPLRVAARLSGLRRVPDVIVGRGDPLPEEVRGLTAGIRGAAGRIETVRSPEYVRWRYSGAPNLGYRTLRASGAAAVFRVRQRGRLIEATIAEMVADDTRAARRILRGVAHQAGADHVTGHFAEDTPSRAAARSALYFRGPRSLTLVARSLGTELSRDPFDFRNWCLSAGDLEVF